MRYYPEITWSTNSWTHNIFRVFELLFGRKVEVRKELSTGYFNGMTVQQAHSFEAFVSLLETAFRHLFEWKPVKLWIPKLSSPLGLPSLSPYLFAIGFDATSSPGTATGGSAITVSHTCTGSNLIIFFATADSGGGLWTAETYNSVGLTQIDSNRTSDIGGNVTCALFSLINPSTGANTASVSYSNPADVIWLGVSSYSGVLQGSLDSSSGSSNNAAALNFTQNTTVVAANCWLVGVAAAFLGTGVGTLGSSQTVRQSTTGLRSGQGGAILADTNATVGTGTQGITFTSSVLDLWGAVVCSIAPAGGGTSTNNLNLLRT